MHDTLGALLAERTWLEGLARSLVHSRDDADDLAQDTWIAALQRRLAVGSARAWLATVAQNRARERARSDARRQRRQAQTAREADSGGATPPEVAVRFETQRRVASAVHELAEPFRSTVLLHYFEGWSLAEIARQQSVPEGTVRWRLHRAHALLRQRLSAALGQDWREALLPLCGVAMRRSSVVAAAGGVLLLALAGAYVAYTWADGSAPAYPAPEIAAAGGAPRVESEPVPNRAAVAAVSQAQMRPLTGAGQAPPRATADQQAIVRVRVVDDGGSGLAGATVAVEEVRLSALLVPADLLRQLAPPVQTDGEGYAALVLRAPSAALALLPKPYQAAPSSTWRLGLMVELAGHVSDRRHVLVSHGDDLDLGRWVLTASSRVLGRVVDAQGTPIDGATAILHKPPFGSHDFASYYAAAGGLVSKVQGGAMQIDAATPGPALLLVAKDGVGRAQRWLRLARGDNVIGDVALLPVAATAPVAAAAPAAGMLVRVEDADGKPVDNARVWHDCDRHSGLDRTNENGTVTVTLMPDDTHIAVTALAAQGVAHHPRTPIMGREVVLRLAAARTVLVRVHTPQVRDAGHLQVAWRSKSGSIADAGKQTAAGEFRLPVPPLPAKLVVSADEHAPYDGAYLAPDEWPETLEVTLRRVHAVQGVVQHAGRALAGAEVHLLEAGPVGLKDGFRSTYDVGSRFVQTDASGRFVFTLTRTMDVALLVQAEGFAPATLALAAFDPAIGHDPVTLDLERGHAVSGRVRRSDGTALPRAIVALSRDLTGARTVATDRQGRFHFAAVAPGAYELRRSDRLLNSGHSWAPLSPRAAMVPTWSNLVVKDADVEQDIVVDACRVQGRMDDAAADWRGFVAELSLPHDEIVIERAPLRADGTFALASFTAGWHRLVVRSPGGGFGEVELVRPIDLQAVDNVVACSVRLVPWQGTVPSTFIEGTHDLVQTGEWTVTTVLRVDPQGRFATPLAPRGLARLRRHRGESSEEIRMEMVEGAFVR